MNTEVIDGATRLENELASTHPRLYFTEQTWPGIRRRIRSRAMARWTRPFLQQADHIVHSLPARGTISMTGDTRRRGCDMATLALAFRLTGKRPYRTAALRLMEASNTHPSWVSLIFGHFAHGFALAYDWMYDTLTPAQRRHLGGILRTRCQTEFERYTSLKDSMAFAYTCNHQPVILAGLTAGAGALFGEYEGPALWLRLVREKVELIRTALGPDGVSPEGIGYGQYYTEFLLKTLAMLDPLLGTDYLPTIPWCREYPAAMLHHAFPRRAWKPTAVFFQFGDSPGHHWYGPDTMLNRCAAKFRNPQAQWLATALRDKGVTCDSANFLNLFWHDPTLPAKSPASLPTFRHFEDMGLVFMRSDWSGSESVLALRCGPAAGHHAGTRFRHAVAGGHMHPSAGTIQLATSDGPLIVHTGYTHKLTAHASTLLVNGKGQLGEGCDWFEDLDFRKGHPAPAITRVESRRNYDYAVADATAAYPSEAGLRRFHRHVIFIKPACWLIVDDLEAAKPASFEILFHLAATPKPDTNGGFIMKRGSSTLRILPVEPSDLCLTVDRRLIKLHHGEAISDCLSITPTRPLRRTRLVTVLQVANGKAALPDVAVSLEPPSQGIRGVIRLGRSTIRFNTAP